MPWLLVIIVLLVIVALIWWWLRSRSAASTPSSTGAAAAAPAAPAASRSPAPAATMGVDPSVDVAAFAETSPTVELDVAGDVTPADADDGAGVDSESTPGDDWSQGEASFSAVDVEGDGDDVADDVSTVSDPAPSGTDESSWAAEAAADDSPVLRADAVAVGDEIDGYQPTDVADEPAESDAVTEARGFASAGAVADGAFGPGSADPADDGAGPAGYDIKGNADSMLYHTTDSPYHGRTKAEVWFDSESSADAAGFTRWDRRDRNAGGSDDEGDDVGVQAFAAVEVPDGAFGPGSADPAEDGSGPAGYDIKGNVDSMLYHTTASAFYSVTKAEIWFQTEEAARNAGFRSFND